MPTPELMLLGGPNSGKTHYAGQLYGRLRRNPGLLRLRKDQGTPSDISALTIPSPNCRVVLKEPYGHT